MKLIVLYELSYLHVCLILYLNKIDWIELNWIELNSCIGGWHSIKMEF